MDKRHLSREESLALLKEYKTPEHVIRHCVAVTDTALSIASALNEKGFSLDLDLIQGAGLIHDIARVYDKHWDVGADIAEDLGLFEEGKIIRDHMFYSPCLKANDVTEIDLVCLGDRLVKEDRYVGLESRMQYILDKAKMYGDVGAEAKIREKTADLQILITDIEKILGATIQEVVEKKG